MNTTLKIMSIAGARPNFMKLASIANAVTHFNSGNSSKRILHLIVHTGQHYDTKMSDSFFTDLAIPQPDINLEVGSASHAIQTAEIMRRFEPVLLDHKPDVLLVVGDVNSTIACTLVASKIEYPLGQKRKRPVIVHVEAGLRSHDRDMPEEINRILTDNLSDLLFVTEQSGINNLKSEGVPDEKIHFVGNVMIDTLQRHLEKAKNSTIKQQLSLAKQYVLVTLHRPSNVDTLEALEPLIRCMLDIADKIPLVFPIHPRTKNNAQKCSLLDCLAEHPNIILSDPLGYLDFLNLVNTASMVITDSGGIQEETTFLRIPCVTLRENTERPVTVTEGSNYLIGTDRQKILDTVATILSGKSKSSSIPKYWDGKAGDRIIRKIVNSIFGN